MPGDLLQLKGVGVLPPPVKKRCGAEREVQHPIEFNLITGKLFPEAPISDSSTKAEASGRARNLSPDCSGRKPLIFPLGPRHAFDGQAAFWLRRCFAFRMRADSNVFARSSFARRLALSPLPARLMK